MSWNYGSSYRHIESEEQESDDYYRSLSQPLKYHINKNSSNRSIMTNNNKQCELRPHQRHSQISLDRNTISFLPFVFISVKRLCGLRFELLVAISFVYRNAIISLDLSPNASDCECDNESHCKTLIDGNVINFDIETEWKEKCILTESAPRHGRIWIWIHGNLRFSIEPNEVR